MSFVNVSEITKFVENKTYEEIVNDSEKYGLCVKYSTDENLKDLYLLANKNNEKEVDFFKSTINYQANGIILEKNTNKIVAMCQNQLYNANKISDIVNSVELDNVNDLRVEYCEDGTMIRLYNYKDSWYTSTTKCIDARKSYWTSTKNFDDLFWEIFDKSLLESLDKNYTYVFVLLHKENRIVVKHKINMLVYISRIHNQTFNEDYTQQFNNIYGIRRPKRINTSEFLRLSISNSDVIKNLYHPYKRGILVKILMNSQSGFWKIYKIDYETYVATKLLRGNVPQIRMRYLELLSDDQQLEKFEKLYYENKFMFNIIKTDILKLIKTIHKLYFESHIKHEVEVKDDNLYYKTLRQLHAQYKTTNNPITFDEVKKKIYNMDKNILKKLLMWE